MELSGEGFRLFEPAHLMIIAAVPALAWVLTLVVRRSPSMTFPIRIGLGSFLVVNELAWYVYQLNNWGFGVDTLPLHLSDITVWITALTCFTLNRRSFEFIYFAGIAGGGMAVLTPDLQWPLTSYPAIQFLTMHGVTIATILFLLWSGQARPRPGSMWWALLYLNIYAGLVGILNVFFDANYMYLCRKPQGASLLDYLGPWPVYILSGEVAAIVLFTLLWLPVRKGSAR